MALRPRVDSEGRPLKPFAKLGDSYEAVTNYKVLSENGSAALVQCTPETGLYHSLSNANFEQDCLILSFM